MALLHICNDFSYSKVYKNLYTELDSKGIQQIIFHPLRDKSNIGKNTFEFQTSGSALIYSTILKKYHRIFFRLKIKKLQKNIETQIDLKSIALINATTLFSDGAIAYKLWKKYNIPYIVTVRHTDVNLFLKYRPDLVPLGLKILRNASNIIFISPSFKRSLFKHYEFKKYENLLEEKCRVIPNGVDKFWLKNRKIKNTVFSRKFLFIGRFDKHKNALNLIHALSKLRDKYSDISLSLVGGGGNKEKEIIELIKKNESWIKFYGKVYDSEKLLQIYREHRYYTMISIYETFGLVYIEALTQGLPVVFTKNQGIDGTFPNYIGEAALPHDIDDIALKIEKLMENEKQLEIDQINFDTFNWESIGKNYINLFSGVIKIQQKINTPIL